MRGAIVHHLLSGHAWFTAGAVLLLLLGAELSGALAIARPAMRSAARILFLLAIGLGALSGTPLPLLLLLPLALSLGAVSAIGFGTDAARGSRVAAGAAMVVIVAALVVEARWHRPVRVGVPAGSTIAVLGDSLSSGGFGEAVPWPARFAAASKLRVANLSLPGETVRSAIDYQLPRLAEIGAPKVVLLEIGGNDLLGETSAEDYAADLDRLLGAVRRERPAAIVMLELPVPPARWRWGAIQRRVAKKHGVVLIPKRVLARVLTDPRLVDDGLHLTDSGHAMLAREIGRVFRVR
ncbi:MAG TPA: GDSL-type esterase/lipase family protein [Thermoanaerobaculia bacterium]|nr:GDSL-type esterase/lipase family protein [Thermoanaerobaculia bacterium]